MSRASIRSPLLSRALGVLALVLSWLTAFGYLSFRQGETEARLLAQIETTQSVAWNAAQTRHHGSVETYFEEYVQQPEVLEVLRRANDPAQRDAARIQLFRLLYPRYESLKVRALRQFHFVLPDGESLLRFHQPDRFGDGVFEIRPSFERVTRERKPATGFELGRITSGFRSVFPIVDGDGVLLGSVELSVPFDIVRREMVRLLPQREYQLLLREDVVAEMLFKEQRHLFAPWPGAPGFMLEDPFGELPDAPPPLSAQAEAVVNALGADTAVQTAFEAGEARTATLPLGDTYYSVALSPILDLSGEVTGYLASYAEEPAAAAARSESRGTLLVVTLLMLALAGAGFRLLRENARKLAERRQLQTINDTLGEGLYVMDDAGNIIHINRRACELLGYESENLLGRCAHELFHCHSGNRHLPLDHCPIFTTVMRGDEYSGRESLQRRDGSLFVARLSSRPIIEPGGIRGAVTTFFDISEQVAMQEALSDSETRYRSVVENVREVIFQADLLGRWRFLNRAWSELSGYSIAEALARPVESFAHPGDCDRVQEAFASLIRRDCEFLHLEARFVCRDGGVRWFDIDARLALDPDARVIGSYGTLYEITERKYAAERLKLAAGVFTHAREGIIITDPQGRVMEVNEAFTRITGYARDEILGQTPGLLKSGRQSREFYEAMWAALLAKGYWDGEIWNRRKSGEVYAEMLTVTAVRDESDDISHFVALFSDITPLKKQQQQLERIAHYDALTGLPNRVLLADRLQQAILQSARSGRALAVLYLDLDGFKAINDCYGHDVGDETLVIVARRMRDVLRESDCFARLGGDEFVAVLVEMEQVEDCDRVLARLLGAASEPVEIQGRALQLSASIGVTLYPEDAGDADQLMRHADQAMYMAKQAGRNCCRFFDVEQDAALDRWRRSGAELKHAFAANEFVLHFQPKVNMKTGAVVGVEALVRWQHPQRGLLPPAAFLPLIAEHRLAVELDDWVLDAAIAQHLEWLEQGLVMAMSVNTSAESLQRVDFPDRLRDRLARAPRLDARMLAFEILETSAVQDIEHVTAVMRACTALGVSFAIDDFGTGYASLTYLRRLPAEQLKIDQSFVRDMLDDPDDLAIVESVVSLSRAFDRVVVAEGVETVEHGDLLLPLGCTLAQGYGIARPMPADDFPGWIDTWTPSPSWTEWQQRTAERRHFPVLSAEVEHRAWIRQLESCLQSEALELPPLHEHQCRFGKWLAGEGRKLCGGPDDFAALSILHQRAHEVGRGLLRARDQGERGGLKEGVAELHACRDRLVTRLRELRR